MFGWWNRLWRRAPKAPIKIVVRARPDERTNNLDRVVYDTVTAQGFILGAALYNPDNDPEKPEHAIQWTMMASPAELVALTTGLLDWAKSSAAPPDFLEVLNGHLRVHTGLQIAPIVLMHPIVMAPGQDPRTLN